MRCRVVLGRLSKEIGAGVCSPASISDTTRALASCIVSVCSSWRNAATVSGLPPRTRARCCCNSDTTTASRRASSGSASASVIRFLIRMSPPSLRSARRTQPSRTASGASATPRSGKIGDVCDFSPGRAENSETSPIFRAAADTAAGGAGVARLGCGLRAPWSGGNGNGNGSTLKMSSERRLGSRVARSGWGAMGMESANSRSFSSSTTAPLVSGGGSAQVAQTPMRLAQSRIASSTSGTWA